MQADFVKALDAEIARLESELGSDSRFVRFRELQRVRGLYSDAKEEEKPSISVRRNVLARQSGRRQSPERAKALENVRLFLLERSGPTTTREILDHLSSLGIPISGEKPLNNLSAMLSNSGQFHSEGRAGWTLDAGHDEAADEGDEATDNDDVYEQIAESVLADYDSTQLRDAQSWVANNNRIPRDMYLQLVAEAEAKFGREASGDEMIELRRTLIPLLKAQAGQ